eukprot:TRINITY_DN946_c0_g1_i12.p1 TRINITY_DN946_c0_g1~~TRINITY_DN946_c0_g1_i12.p1  ORF type:complete len:2710 (+),score=766.26 TRINITY_DN946_c0_g1_i12:124-8253(+)
MGHPQPPQQDVRQYAEQHKVLKLVDDLVNAVLRNKPECPLEYLAEYLVSRSKGGDKCDMTPDVTPVLANKMSSSRGGTAATRTALTLADRTDVSWEESLRRALDNARNSPGGNLESIQRIVKETMQKQKVSVPSKPSPTDAGVLSPKSGAGAARTELRTLSSKSGAADTTPVHSKFDASDDATGRAVGVELVHPYPKGFKPQENVTEVVDGLGNWHAAGRQLWPVGAINRVKQNCRFMQHRHNYHESTEVVLPLYIYSITVMADTAWMFWVSSGPVGRWAPIGSELGVALERAYHKLKMQKKYSDEVLDMQHVNSLMMAALSEERKQQVRCREGTDAGTESLGQLPTSLQMCPIFYRGKIVGGPDVNPTSLAIHTDKLRKPSATSHIQHEGKPLRRFPGWRGLTVLVNKRFLHKTAGNTTPLSREISTDAFEDSAVEFYLARLHLPDRAGDKMGKKVNDNTAENPDDDDESHLRPYADTVTWLPAPSCLFPRLVDSAKQDGVPWKSLKGNLVTMPEKTIPFEKLPPPGLLEYLQSRMTREELSLRLPCQGNGKDLVLISEEAWKSDSEARQLVEKCVREHNQQRYNQVLHMELKKLLKSDQLADFKKLIDGKLGPKGEDGSVLPTPLNIIHALDIQELRWSASGEADKAEPLYASLSGKRLLISDRDSESKPCPLFKWFVQYADQPYWHLNAAMRNLQNKSAGAELTIPSDIDVATTQEGWRDKKTETKRTAFRPRNGGNLGAGILCMSEVADRYPVLRSHLTAMSKLQWLTALDSEDSEDGGWSVMYTAKGIHKGMKHIDTVGDTGHEAEYTEDYLDPVWLNKVGWWLCKPDGDLEYLDQRKVSFSIGTYMVRQVRSLLFYINYAMENMSKQVVSMNWDIAPKGEQKCYRGLRDVKLDPDLYSQGNVVLWAALSSTSMDQGISAAYADGKDASVFIIRGTKCRLIAPWSRFGREEEWLYPLNSMFQVKSMLTKDQQDLLGAKDFQLFEIEEVPDHEAMVRLKTRMLLSHAETKQSAGIIFAAINALDGTRVLDLSLKEPSEGSTRERWVYSVFVHFDGLGLAPAVSYNDTRACKREEVWDIANFLFSTIPKGHSKTFEPGPKTDRILQFTSALLGLGKARTPSFVEAKCQGKSADAKSQGKVRSHSSYDAKYQAKCPSDTTSMQKGRSQSSAEPECHGKPHPSPVTEGMTRSSGVNLMTLKAITPKEQWVATVELVKEEGHSGFAIGDEGSKLIGKILKQKVQLHRIDVRNNLIKKKGAEDLLEGLRHNSHVTQLLVAGEAEDADMGPVQIAIDILCMHNKGRVEADKLLAFGSEWPHYAAEALYHLDRINVEFSRLFEADSQGTVEFLNIVNRLLDERKRVLTKERPPVQGAAQPLPPPPLPKLPGALVAAARCADLGVVKLLIDKWKCSPLETDEFGETPYLKLKRRRGNGEDIMSDDRYTEVVKLLHVCLPDMQPPRLHYDDAMWKVKNFALMMMRMADNKKDTLLQELYSLLYRNLTESKQYEEAKQLSTEDLEKILADFLAKLHDHCTTCMYLQRMKLSGGRFDATLLCLMAICADRDHLRNELLCTPVPEQEGSFLHSTGRRKSPCGRFVTREMFRSALNAPWNSKKDWGWLKATEEDPKERRLTNTGVYYFMHEYAKYSEEDVCDGVDILAKSQPDIGWDGLENDGYHPTGRRLCTVGKEPPTYMTSDEYFEAMWAAARPEPDQEKHKNANGVYVFEEDWREVDGKWGEAEPLQKTLGPLHEVLKQPSLNLYDPKVFGSRVDKEESRSKLQACCKLWAGVNAVLAGSEEKDRVLFSAMDNQPDAVIFHHLQLTRGQVYCMPDISLWRAERRKPNPRHFDGKKAIHTLNSSKAKQTLKSLKVIQTSQKGSDSSNGSNTTTDPERPQTQEEFAEFFHDTGDLWRKSERRWTEKGYRGELLYKDEFEERLSLDEDPVDTPRRACRKNTDTLPPTWEEADPEDPHSTEEVGRRPDTAGSMQDGVEGQTHINRIIFTARGRMLGEWLGSITEKGYDVILPALETFVVEDIRIRGKALDIRLISRGSLLKMDREISTWCKQMQETLVRDTVVNETLSDPETYVVPPNNPLLRAPTTMTLDESLRASCRLDGAEIFYGRASLLLPKEGRVQLTKEISALLAPVNGYADHINQVGVGKVTYGHKTASDDSNIKPLPRTYRPSYTFLEQLGRKKPEIILEHIPYVELKTNLTDRDANEKIELSHTTIDKTHAEVNSDLELDPLYKELDEKPPPAAEVYGEEVFEITVGEVVQLIKSSRLVCSPDLPKKFLLELISKFTANESHVAFFSIFKSTSFLAIATDRDEKWDKLLQDALAECRNTLDVSKGRKKDAERDIEDPTKADRRDANRQKLYRNNTLIAIEDRQIAFLKNAVCDCETRELFRTWVQDVLKNPIAHGFISHQHAVMTLEKSMIELSTEICVTQRGHFFTSGVDDAHNVLCKRDRTIAFLASPGLDFCYRGPTKHEAPKYFDRIPLLEEDEDHVGWSYFREGKAAEFRHRVKTLYKCIFEAAQQQGVRNMCMLPMGLGVFTTNLSHSLKLEVAEHYFRAQYELLSEKDWGFDNYWMCANQFQDQAVNVLNSGLCPNGDYNNVPDGLFLRCNVIFHGKDAKFLASHLASLGMSPSFLNPSDCQAVMGGNFGMYWEEGRSWNCAGEEDWGATSTGVLMWYSICGDAIGLNGSHSEDNDEPSTGL